MSEHATHCKQAIMARVLEIRYTDLEEEKKLCQELLIWAEETGDYYGRAFSHTYLGDYFVAQNDSSQALFHLMKGKQIMGESGLECPELMLRAYSLLAICYEMQADEQSSMEYYLEAISMARQIGDTASECMVLNNLAFAFQRHRGYEEAREYYESAYQLCGGSSNAEYAPLLLSNLTELFVELGDIDKARHCVEECEQLLTRKEDQEAFQTRIRCCYHAAAGEVETALRWADCALKNEEQFTGNRLTAFEDYNMFCKSMLRIGDKSYTYRFLKLMEAACGGGLDQLKTLEERRMECSLSFAHKHELPQAYRDYYRKTTELKKLANQAIVSAMKAKIALDQALTQKETLQTEQENLERQANLDELTQLYNRRYLDYLVREYASNSANQISVIMLDVDYFKEYNDFYGHIEGDKVLQTIAACLLENRIKGISACRFGGDEFTCLCVDITEEQLEEYIRRVRADLVARAMPHEKSHCSSVVTLSIGYSVGELGGTQDPYLLLQLADQALYDTKILGRNSYTRKQAGAI